MLQFYRLLRYYLLSFILKQSLKFFFHTNFFLVFYVNFGIYTDTFIIIDIIRYTFIFIFLIGISFTMFVNTP